LKTAIEEEAIYESYNGAGDAAAAGDGTS